MSLLMGPCNSVSWEILYFLVKLHKLNFGHENGKKVACNFRIDGSKLASHTQNCAVR
jgi:hypothetical protein